jgi:octaprenyl-diphosphate synthase
MTALHETKAFEYTRNLAEQEAEKARQALALLPDSEHKQALLALANIAVSRSH